MAACNLKNQLLILNIFRISIVEFVEFKHVRINMLAWTRIVNTALICIWNYSDWGAFQKN